MGVTEISALSGVNKSTISKILHVLQEYGYVVKNSQSGRYFLGGKFVMFSSKVLKGVKFTDVARPFLAELAQKTGETVNLGVISGTKVLYADVINTGENALHIVNQIGKTEHMHTSALGKALLAYSPGELMRHIIDVEGLPSFSENTIVDEGELMRQIDQIRTLGYATDNEECEPGVRCVGSPILNRQGEVIASISISGYAGRFTHEKMELYSRMILDTARSISVACEKTGVPL